MAVTQNIKINHGYVEPGSTQWPDATLSVDIEYDNGVWSLKNIKLSVTEIDPIYGRYSYTCSASDVTMTQDS